MYDAQMIQTPLTQVKPGEGRLAHAAPDHPPVPPARVGVVLANLGTPDATDYWSMRRYLGEFLSDKRVIDYPLALAAAAAAGDPDQAPVQLGEAYRGIWNTERTRARC
jgi:protoporphyrin/coproporphyrin ferrochelatase